MWLIDVVLRALHQIYGDLEASLLWRSAFRVWRGLLRAITGV